jgi:hypothetical protein
VAAAPAGEGLSHHALFYRDQQEYVQHAADLVRAGLASTEPVLVALPGPMGQLVSAELNDESRQVA